MNGRMIAVAGLLGWLVSAPAWAEQISSFDIGNWNGGAYTHTQTGDFSHCAASAQYRSGITLVFSIDRQLTWAMGLANESWKLAEGDSYPVRYWVDRGSDFTGTATAITATQVKIPLPGDDRLFLRMRRGSVLTVRAANQTMKFSLKSTNQMLSTLFNCAKHWRDRDVGPTPDNPFSDDKPEGNPFSRDDSGNPFAAEPRPVRGHTPRSSSI